MRIKRKIKGICLLFVIVCVIFASGYYVLRVSPYHFHIISQDVSNSLIPEEFIGFKIGFFSDLDISTSEDLDYLESCINSINNEQCDMIIFGGDIYENGNAFDQERLISLLDSIQVPYGKFAVLGENEFMTNLEEANLLRNTKYRKLCAEGICKGICAFFDVKYIPESEEEEEQVKRYQKIEDLPYGKDVIQKLVEEGVLSGDKSGNLNLSEDMLRVFVILARKAVI